MRLHDIAISMLDAVCAHFVNYFHHLFQSWQDKFPEMTGRHKGTVIVSVVIPQHNHLGSRLDGLSYDLSLIAKGHFSDGVGKLWIHHIIDKEVLGSPEIPGIAQDLPVLPDDRFFPLEPLEEFRKAGEDIRVIGVWRDI